MKTTGAQAMVKALTRHGVKQVFGYPGAAICPFYDAILDSDIHHVLVRNEQGAAHAANGYARAGKRTGVCIATSGPGATNLITGIATAYMDSIPLIVITGQVSRDLIGSDSFQEADTTGATTPFTKHNYLVAQASELPRIFAEAFYLASSGRPGPVLIDVPVDVQTEEFDDYEPIVPVLPGYNPPSQANSADIEMIRKLLSESTAPIICAGGGLISSHSSDLFGKFVDDWKLPVVTTMMGIGVLPWNHQLNLGTLGSHGVYAANYALHHADLIILMGARAGNRAMGSASEIARKATVIHIDIDPAEIGKNIRPHLSVQADIKKVLEQLLMTHPQASDKHKKWLEKIADLKIEYDYDDYRYDKSEFISPPSIIRKVGLMAEAGAIITTEVGQNQIWAANHYPITNLDTFITSGGMGTMGFGLPAAVGAQKACPEKYVIAVSGDGSLQMSLQELGTVKQEKLPLKIVLLNNSRLGMVHEIQSLKYQNRYSQVFLEENPDFQLLAEAYGFAHEVISSNDQIEAAIKRMLASDKPYLLECLTDPHEPTLYHKSRRSKE
ncbi:MAG: biosynthetic-type acetolactate synthase large subunit [Eubacteriales bacterium]|nr:biosynthetic-type acetolactate synthase large subunit [Eubacteriales bacterium]MDD3198131.1 biosynthetic-type acetolactate synthase large subunit [Eubacteriales bacterium]MDD3504131.1 biosynthetic-type acetolactate synthase large subunit [Eubacteriales bacterium]